MEQPQLSCVDNMWVDSIVFFLLAIESRSTRRSRSIVFVATSIAVGIIFNLL